MSRGLCLITSPFQTRSGYGDLARSFIRDFIKVYGKTYTIKLASLNWGMTPMNAEVEDLKQYIIYPPYNFFMQPDLLIHIGVPTEINPIGKFNIVYTASAECDITSKEMLNGANKAQLLLASSNHVKNVFESTRAEEKDQAGNIVAQYSLKIPVETLVPSIDLNIFKKTPELKLEESISDELVRIKERFCFLFVGQWLKGDINEDRKNISMLIKIFGETFKNTQKSHQPALILKTSGAGFSIIDREECLTKIKAITNSIGPMCPNVYLLHGDLTSEEMNSLYNHPKVKAMVSFSKGEGLSLPQLEFSMIDKPIINSGWSGPLDFLNEEDSILVSGQLEPVPAGAVYEPFIISQAKWLSIDVNGAASALMWLYKNYEHFYSKAKTAGKKNRKAFNSESRQALIKEIFEKHVPKPQIEVPLNLPTLKKLGDSSQAPVLPVLKKLVHATDK